MIYYSSDSQLFKLPHYFSMWLYYQDDNFGSYIAASSDIETQVIEFITEDLH